MPMKTSIELTCGRCSRAHGKPNGATVRCRTVRLVIEDRLVPIGGMDADAELPMKETVLVEVADGCPACIERVVNFAKTYNKAYPGGRISRRKKEKQPELPGMVGGGEESASGDEATTEA